MPNKKSAIKRMRQNEKRYNRNREVKSRLHTVTRKVIREAENNNVEEAKKALPEAIRTINKTAQKGVIHKKKAARMESRLVKKVAALSSKTAPEPPPSKEQ